MRDFEDSTFDTHEVPPQAKACLRLWAAKLLLHTKDYAAGKRELGRSGKVLNPEAINNAIAAQEWISSESRLPGSFLWVCDVFGLNPDSARNSILYGWRKNLALERKDYETDGRVVRQLRKV